jgi:hypothetical protein
MPRSTDEMIQQLLRGDRPGPAPAAMGLPEAQATDLRQRWADCQPASGLRPGDLVVPRHGIEPATKCGHLHVGIVWRLLEWSEPQDRVLIEDALRRSNEPLPVDCLVARLSHEGDLVLTPTNRRAWVAWAPGGPT